MAQMRTTAPHVSVHTSCELPPAADPMSLAACDSPFFECDDKCLPPEFVCDGQLNCLDAKDEQQSCSEYTSSHLPFHSLLLNFIPNKLTYASEVVKDDARNP